MSTLTGSAYMRRFTALAALEAASVRRDKAWVSYEAADADYRVYVEVARLAEVAEIQESRQ